MKWNGGVADAVKAPGEDLWGVLYEIDGNDLRALDGFEGYNPERSHNSYFRRGTELLMDGDPSHVVVAQVYFANPEEDPPLPSSSYMNRILSGARSAGLPQAYIAKLEEFETGT